MPEPISIYPNNYLPPATLDAAPFWAIYFVTNTPNVAVAVAVHPSGQTEQWRWDGGQWLGFRRNFGSVVEGDLGGF